MGFMIMGETEFFFATALIASFSAFIGFLIGRCYNQIEQNDEFDEDEDEYEEDYVY